MSSPPSSQLPITQWTLIARLRHGTEQEARRAVDELCAQYRYPLYCYIRKHGHAHHDAEDILHDYFAKLLRNDAFASADAALGRLRAMLITGLCRFLITWAQRQRQHPMPLTHDGHSDFSECEHRYMSELFSPQESPDEIYNRKWTLELLAAAQRRLGNEYELRGKAPLFRILSPVLMGNSGSLRGVDTPALAAQAGLTEGALRVALLRLLDDFRGALRHEILETVADPVAARDEFQLLRTTVRARNTSLE